MQRCRPQRRRSNVFDRFINQTLSQGGDTSPLSARACGLHGKAVFKENVLEKIDKLFEEILYFRIKSYDGDMCISVQPSLDLGFQCFTSVSICTCKP